MKNGNRPSEREVEDAVSLLIRWIGDDINRPGLSSTPRRILNAYKKFFIGYEDISLVVGGSVLHNEGYDGIITFKDIRFISYCEHHIVPMRGKVSIGYVPNKFMFTIGQVVRLVNYFAKRLQIQERLTIDIAKCIDSYLFSKGVIVVINATHECVLCHEENSGNLLLQTSYALGVFQNNMELRQEFLNSIN
ncbi:GTP cyclohydrolase I [Ehrlichia ruminantium]|uniref:GTP cyclohydrolase 1 n=1 Tax=Ehrlichia ruminantium TaxID=779 RepID=A0AAE6UKP1_EHRRU|nr:GTP cyclohydrolase I [Ehrlichia ruminantium]QGR02469.1 GTP cyclohydrolase I [Ehrlichia ruminantium]QGR03388.1 GTP cyclohydrolase I [Ehrlichia ruminantium]QGR04315.1 GTP cyclohydrolase I [Ehrlichia ruminantium]